MIRRMLAAVVVVVLGAAALAGCGASAPPRISATPARSFWSVPFTLRVTRVAPGSEVTIRLSAHDAAHREWTSRAVFRADASGVAATSRAPVSGDYRGARTTGLVEALRPGGSTPRYFDLPTTPWTMTATATAGGATARTTIARESCSQVVTATRLPSSTGLVGELFEPRSPASTARPGVLVWGGSEGGLSTILSGCALAAAGYPALSLAYFHAPGLPADLENVPIEYFASAARYLQARAHVDPQRIVAWGDSRGGEAAYLVASEFPDLVHSVVSTVGSPVAERGLPDATQPAWTLGGAPVPTDFTSSPTPEGTGAIPIERIRGSILAICEGADEVWPSCPYAQVASERLTLQGTTVPFTLHSYPLAGHFAGSLLAGVPTTILGGTTASGLAVHSGGTALANAEASDDGWGELLRWLATQAQ